ncbi:MAG: T9SS type A sorting domain-containing protein, partial [Cytophagaceae bacterium]
NADGSLDEDFNPGSGFVGIDVQSLSFQSDGKILVGGSFTSYNGITRNRIARLNADGSLDESFNPGTGFNAGVRSISLQNDNKILIGGEFTSFDGSPRNYIVRINTDGTLDEGFYPGTGFDRAVTSIATQSDGKIIAGGEFISFNGIGRNRIARLIGDPEGFNTIKGYIYTDSNNDCQYQPTENTLSNVIVKATPGPFYGSSDINGHYTLKVDSGSVSYTIIQQHNSIYSKLLVNQCAPSHTVELTGSDKDTCCFDFANEVRQCALLNVSLQNTRMRRCFRSNTFVTYWNYGNEAANNAELRVVYPSYVYPISSTPMWTSREDSVLIYNLSSLEAGASGRISIVDSVICWNEEIRGLTQCIKAIISPASNCIQPSSEWDRSSINVRGNCVDGLARFVITNGGSGSMSGDHEYRVFVNDTLVYKGEFRLGSSETLTVTYPAEGKTVRLEADQHPLHPGRSRPRASVEGCGASSPGKKTTGMVLTAPKDDLDEEVAFTCNPIIDSYDPNDKLVIPVGFGTVKRIDPGQVMDYTIRFQNTGTDTAYTVVIVDTLDVHFDVASFIGGTSSHNYTLAVSGKEKAVLTFTYNNIMLPDSTTNEPLSNGLVTFKIKVSDDTPLGTVITNKAYIFFDYNSAIITNETMHTVDVGVDEDFSRGALVREYFEEEEDDEDDLTGISKNTREGIKIFPNPTEGVITIALSDHSKESILQVYSAMGVLQKEVQLSHSQLQEISLTDLHSGMYIYRILQNGEVKSRGMLKVK